MSSQVKFYARHTYMKGINMSGSTRHIFDSDFSYATIEDSAFDRVDFYNCDLAYASFRNASFKQGYLYRLITDCTKFDSCDFTKTIMSEFNFDNCIFRGCDFTRCDMECIVFKDCSFYGCNFKKANLPPFFHPRQMIDCKNIPYIPMACPEEGEFIGYKIAADRQLLDRLSILSKYENYSAANVLVTLKVPADAKRSSAGGRKCRCDKAIVIGLEDVFTHGIMPIAYSKYDGRFIYRIGDEINEPDFNENRWDECSEGIHFFINRKEALQYYNLMETYYDRKQC